VNAGPASARNTGAAAAQADLLGFTDADCIPDPHWLSGLLAAIGEEGVGAAYGRVVTDPGYPFPRWAAPAGFALVSASMIARRDSFECVGGFASCFTAPFREDTDFAMRLVAAGVAIAGARQGAVYHPVRRHDLRRLWRVGQMHEFDVLLARRHGLGALAGTLSDSTGIHVSQAYPPGISPAGAAITLGLAASALAAARGRPAAALGVIVGLAFAAAAGTYVANMQACGREPARGLENALAGIPYFAGWYVGRVRGSVKYHLLCV
jgi:hypothetical protein